MESSTREPTSDQHSDDVIDLYDQYPVGTYIASWVFSDTDQCDYYQVVSREEYEREEGEVLEFEYLGVKLLLDSSEDYYDGLPADIIEASGPEVEAEYKLMARKITVNLRYEGVVRDLLIEDEGPSMPWIPSEFDMRQMRKDMGIEVAPQPKYGWRG